MTARKASTGLVFAGLLGFAVVAAVTGTAWFVFGGGIAALALAAASPLALVAGIGLTVHDDARRNQAAAHDWDKAAPSRGASQSEPAAPEAPAVTKRPAYSVSGSGEVERLADAGSAVMGLVIGVSVFAFAAYYVVAALFPAVVSR